MEEVALVADIDSYEEGEETVALMTLHSAKGLEYPVVFVVDVNEGIVPHHKAGLPADHRYGGGNFPRLPRGDVWRRKGN